MVSIVVPGSTIRFFVSTDMRDLGLAALPGATSDVDIISGGTAVFDGSIYSHSVTYTLDDRVITFFGSELEVLTASTGGPLSYSLHTGSINAISITGLDGTTPLASFTQMNQDVTPLHNALFGPEAIFMAALLSGYDHVTGSTGYDTLAGYRGGDTLLGGDGRDLLLGDLGSDFLLGGGDRDRLLGGHGADTLRGHSGNDQLSGHRGADRLEGGAGQDRLQGGAGNDRLTGGGGADRFVFRNHDGADRITDFVAGQDKIVIELAAGDPTNIGLSFTYSGGDAVVTFLDMTLTLDNIATGSLNFTNGGDVLLVAI